MDAGLLIPREGNAEKLTAWITRTHSADLPFLHSSANGLERDRAAVDASLTLSHHNGRTEGTHTKIKLLKRLMYGRPSHRLPRHIILLDRRTVTDDQRLRKSWKSHSIDSPPPGRSS